MSSFFSAQPAAAWLHQQKTSGASFEALSGVHLPPTMGEAYDIAEQFVALRCTHENAHPVGYKIALTTPQMRAFVGYQDSIAGVVLSSATYRSGIALSAKKFIRMAIECEIAFLVSREITKQDLASTESIAQCIEAAAPAFELVDDLNADYSRFGKDDGATLKSLAAGNAWNHGVVLGEWMRDWRSLDLSALRGQISINGKAEGEGFGRDVLGHPLEAMRWIAAHLLGRGKSLKPGEFVITGSLVTTKFPLSGDSLQFLATGLGEVTMKVTD
jgi:2-keto-4-pentenoate hydratase